MYLILNREQGEKSDYAAVEYQLQQIFKTNFLEDIKRSYHESQITYSTLPESIKAIKSSSIIMNPEVRGNDFLVRFDAMEIQMAKINHKKVNLIPIIISSREKISKNEKLSLTIKTLLSNQTSGYVSEVGKIIHGRYLKSALIRIKDYKNSAQKLISSR